MASLPLSTWWRLVEQDAKEYVAQELGYEGAFLTHTEAGFAIVPGSELSPDDSEYLQQQQERHSRREHETKELELGYFSRMGWHL